MNSMNPLHNFCPDPSRLDLEWLEPVVEAGVTLRPFRMTTFQLPDGRVRTYGLVGFPEGRGPFPAILHIHGGCQTASRGNLLYNIRRGYAAMSFFGMNRPESRPPAGVHTLLVELKGAPSRGFRAWRAPPTSGRWKTRRMGCIG